VPQADSRCSSWQLDGDNWEDGKWVLGTFFYPVKNLSFNTKGERVHGCIHSSPQLPAVPPGKVEVRRGRLYLMPGTLQSLWPEYRKKETRGAADAEAGR
jgi:hypothetical protein